MERKCHQGHVSEREIEKDVKGEGWVGGREVRKERDKVNKSDECK